MHDDESKLHTSPIILQRAANSVTRRRRPKANFGLACATPALAGFKFRRQHPIDHFIVDFCCPACRLVVEIDGDSHADQVARDAERTARLIGRGYRVIRFTNRDVENHLDGVLEAILAACEASE